MDSVAASPILPTMTHLADCLLPLQESFEATTEILYSYCRLLKLYLSYQSTSSEAVRIHVKLVASEEWLELQDILQDLPNMAVNVVLSVFETIWAGVTAVIDSIIRQNPTRFNPQYWETHIDYHGLTVLPVVQLVCNTVRGMSPKLKERIKHIISSQPRYNDIQNDPERQLNARQLSGTDTMPDLARVITAVYHSPGAVKETVPVFAELVKNATEFCQNATRSPSDLPAFGDFPALGDFINEIMIDAHRSLVSDPFSDLTLATRQELALCDIRGTINLLASDAATFMSVPSYTGLFWDMFKKFVDDLMQFANAQGPACVNHVKEALLYLDLHGFLDADSVKDDTWTWPPRETVTIYEPDSEFDLHDLPDVCFEPVGPPLQVEQHALAVTKVSDLPEEDCSICRDTLNVHETVRDEVPVKAECDHTFHYDCLSTLINGLFKFSNLCPNCRRPVCDRRSRRLKDDEELISVHALDEEELARVERFLQDREGDVVMTD